MLSFYSSGIMLTLPLVNISSLWEKWASRSDSDIIWLLTVKVNDIVLLGKYRKHIHTKLLTEFMTGINSHLNVPLSTSWPLSLTWFPSFSNEPNARASPKAQSASLLSIILPRAFNIRFRPATQLTSYPYFICNWKETDMYLYNSVAQQFKHCLQ